MLIKIDDLVKIFGSISELKNNLNLIGGGKFNDSIKTDVVVDKNGITIYDSIGTFKWSKWNTPQTMDYDISALLVTDFKPTATFTNGPEVVIKDVAFTLVTVPRRR